MAKVRVNITIDEDIKNSAKELFDYMGIDLSTAINLFLWQAVEDWGFPFQLKTHRPNKKTVKAIKEYERIRKNPRKYERYVTSIEKLKKELDAEDNKD